KKCPKPERCSELMKRIDQSHPPARHQVAQGERQASEDGTSPGSTHTLEGERKSDEQQWRNHDLSDVLRIRAPRCGNSADVRGVGLPGNGHHIVDDQEQRTAEPDAGRATLCDFVHGSKSINLIYVAFRRLHLMRAKDHKAEAERAEDGEVPEKANGFEQQLA